MTDRAILVDFDGDNASGCYRIIPANEASEPAIDFEPEHYYGYADESLPTNYASRAEARAAAERRAARLARSIGGVWLTNEN